MPQEGASGDRSVATGSVGEGAVVIPGDHNVVNLGRRPPSHLVVGEIPQRPPSFQERPEIMAGLRADDRVTVVRSVSGAPGVGKTTMAAAHARECQAAGYQVVAWIHAEEREGIAGGLARLADRLGIRRPQDTAAEAAERARDWLAAATKPCLVVFDNAEQVADLRRWVPATGSTQVVITTRNRAFDRLGAAVPVEVFTSEESVAFLARVTGLDDPPGAAELAAELGQLALALAQAGAMIEERGLTYAGYLRVLRAKPLAQGLRGIEGDAYPDSAVRAILLAVEAAESSIAGAGELLSVFSVLSPDGVPREMLPDDTEDVLVALVRRSLLTWSQDRRAVVMHRVTQRALRERDPSRLPAALEATAEILRGYWLGHATWGDPDSVGKLMTQAEVVHAHSGDHPPIWLLRVRSWYAKHVTHHDDPARALELTMQNVADCERVLGPHDRLTLYAISDLADAYGVMDDEQEALRLYRHVLAEWERIAGPDDEETVEARSDVARSLDDSGQHELAVPLHESVVAHYERTLGPDHRKTLRAHRRLANSYGDTGAYEQAIALHERILADFRRTLDPDHDDIVRQEEDLSSAYADSGDLERGIALREQALAHSERISGPTHLFTLNSRYVLAMLYAQTGDTDTAIRLCEEVLELAERTLGAGHKLITWSQDYLTSHRRPAPPPDEPAG
ncbi:tetratricopeptide repeat protein [Nonomuraea sp. NPDC050536]|uniref:tetratricopeptide repeat protein n=1 Tax=Nonomuraea sp. NPDC050536 TaxID=3364366 RepID=UPI0037C60670